MTATFFIRIIGPLQRIPGDAVGKVIVGSTPKWPTPEDEFVSADTKRPPINAISIASLQENSIGDVRYSQAPRD